MGKLDLTGLSQAARVQAVRKYMRRRSQNCGDGSQDPFVTVEDLCRKFAGVDDYYALMDDYIRFEEQREERREVAATEFVLSQLASGDWVSARGWTFMQRETAKFLHGTGALERQRLPPEQRRYTKERVYMYRIPQPIEETIHE